MKNIYNKELNDFARLTRHYQDWEAELAKPNKDYITTDYFCPRRDVSYDDCLNKLGQLEDIEDELGIDLITLFKALKNGIYYKHYLKGDIVFDDGTYNRISLYDNGINIDLDEGWFYFMYKDYGKTWALTKEELE